MTMHDDLRFTLPRYTVAEAAHYLAVPPRTFEKWVYGYRFVPSGRDKETVGEPIIQSTEPRRRGVRLTFAALVEGLVIAGLRQADVSLQTLRRAVGTLRDELGIEWALASERLFVSGPDILWNYAEQSGDHESLELVAVASGQRVFPGVVRDYLDRITYADDAYARAFFLPVTRPGIIEVDPLRSLGQPVFVQSGAPVRAVLGRVLAGEPVESVARDHGIPKSHVREAFKSVDALAA